MTKPHRASSPVTAESFGRHVLGPIVAEFCLRLWIYSSLLQRKDETGQLFCARGGLRIRHAYESFLMSSELASPLQSASLMVSRLVAVRPALMRGVISGSAELAPAAAQTLAYEFPRSSIADIALALTDCVPENSYKWQIPFSSEAFTSLLRHPDGDAVVTALAEQTALFSSHLRAALGGRSRALLVDTGLFGTTQQLIAEGFPDVEFSSALIARSNYRRVAPAHYSKVVGLSVEADSYASWNRRSSMLRYWHYVESLFEPDLPSVKLFSERAGQPVSNLEVIDWQARILPTPGTVFSGVMTYLESLSPGSAGSVEIAADRAWSQFRKAVIWPDSAHGRALDAGQRTGDFGTALTWTAREWRGPLAALRGASMWREGEIARSGTRLRLPLLAAIEAAYGARRFTHSIKRRLT